MRKIIISALCLIVFLNFSIYSQENDQQAISSNENLMKEQRMFLNMMITGIILTSIGGVTLASGLTLDTIILTDPGLLPLTYHLSYSKTIHNRTYNYNMDFNPVSFSLDLTGIALLAVGIPLLAVGGANYRKIKSKMMSAIVDNKLMPELAYNLNDRSFYLGARFSF